MDNGAEKLASSMEAKLREFSPDIFNYGTVCIYKVPEKHRVKNERAYSPRLVSIGFIHHGEIHLQAIEKYKMKYLSHFLHTFRVSLKDLAKFVFDQQKQVCSCYEDSKELKSNTGEVILLDAIFILDLFLKNHFLGMREKAEVVFDNPSVSNDILHDLLLLENQLPFTFLSKLYDEFVLKSVRISLDDGANYHPSFDKLVHKYFKDVASTEKLLLTDDLRHARHFVEFLSILHAQKLDEQKNVESRLDFAELKAAGVNFMEGTSKSILNFAKCPSATELKAAGVRFKEGTSKSLLNVDFEPKKGELEIPTLTVSDSTETFFHNLIAFERSEYNVKHITSSVVLLGNLIKTQKDVDILIQNHIIVNELGSSEKVALLFSNLYKDLVVAREVFLYVETCFQLNCYNRDKFHQLKAKYATTPLLQAAGIAALVTIVLTLVSTACSVLQVLGIGSLK